MNYLHVLFEPFVEKIHQFYGKAGEDAGVDPATLPIALEELSFNRGAFESEFAATPEPSRVRITWNGMASLWAFSQGAVGVARVMFEAQREANPEDPPQVLPVEGEMLTAHVLLSFPSALPNTDLTNGSTGCPSRTFWPTTERPQRGISSFSAPWAGSWVMNSRTMS